MRSCSRRAGNSESFASELRGGDDQFPRLDGYGQKFTDSISGDWGGKPYIDLMKGTDYVEKTFRLSTKNRDGSDGRSLRRLYG